VAAFEGLVFRNWCKTLHGC